MNKRGAGRRSVLALVFCIILGLTAVLSAETDARAVYADDAGEVKSCADDAGEVKSCTDDAAGSVGEAETCTVTVDAGGHGSSFTIPGVPKGTPLTDRVYEAMNGEYGYPVVDGGCLRDMITLKPLDQFKDRNEYEEDWNAVQQMTVTEDVTVYLAWRPILNEPVTLNVAPPAAGDAAHKAPSVTCSNSKYEILYSVWEDADGNNYTAFEKGRTYEARVHLTPAAFPYCMPAADPAAWSVTINGKKASPEWISADGAVFVVPLTAFGKGWQKTAGEWYYYKADGTRLTGGWAKDGRGWCYLGSDGRIERSKWIKDKGEWYYLKSNGYMAANEWAKDSRGWMYMNAGGRITKSKWIRYKSAWYYMKANGYMATGTQKIGGRTYTFSSSGKWIR